MANSLTALQQAAQNNDPLGLQAAASQAADAQNWKLATQAPQSWAGLNAGNNVAKVWDPFWQAVKGAGGGMPVNVRGGSVGMKPATGLPIAPDTTPSLAGLQSAAISPDQAIAAGPNPGAADWYNQRGKLSTNKVNYTA